MPSRANRILFWCGAALALAGLFVLRVFTPGASNIFPPCPLHTLTGWYCPGCGSLRALHQLLHGNLGAAFAFNPFAVLSLPFLSYGLASYASLQIRGRALPRWFIPAPWIWALGCAIVFFGIARNIPAYPFNLLAPGGMLRP
jgi:Protein of unknown function (DUF2752)